MLLRSVALKSIRDSLRGLVFWSLGLAGLVGVTVSVYPSVRDNPSLDELVETYPEALKGFVGIAGDLDFTSGPGYLGVELFSFMVPLLLLIAAIAAGSAALAGEEDRGTLELLLSAPVSRRRIVAEKLAALVVELIVLGCVLFAVLVVSAHLVEMDVGTDELAAATAGSALLALAFGAIAVLVGAWTGRRGLTVGVVSAAAVAAYLVNSLAPLVSWLEAARPASPFSYYTPNELLMGRFAAGDALVLITVAAGASALAVIAFARRDVAV